MTFVKGVSGNPKGKPKGAISIIQQIKQYYQVHPEELHKRIERLAIEPKYDQLWVNYLEGLPQQKTEVTVSVEKPILGGTSTSLSDELPKEVIGHLTDGKGHTGQPSAPDST